MTPLLAVKFLEHSGPGRSRKNERKNERMKEKSRRVDGGDREDVFESWVFLWLVCLPVSLCFVMEKLWVPAAA